MNAIEIVGDIIDFVVMLIQAPYVFICGVIMGDSYVPGIGSNSAYVWQPTIGVIKMYMRPYGDMAYDVITYKELFR